ncbi:MAG: glycosyltransferase family 4 protein [Clostridia bacterium]|nr:glycosyltransferase family 4 protein [Clostridia bacterium]
MQKSVVIITSYDGPYGGNFIASLCALDKKLKEKGLKTVYIFQEKVKDFSWIPTVETFADTIYFLPYRPNSFDNIKRIRRILNDENAVLIYSRMSGWDIAAHLAKPSLPIIWHMEMNPNIADSPIKKLKYIGKYRIIGRKNVYSVAASYPAAKTLNTLNLKNKCVAIQNATDFNRLVIKNKETLSFKKPVNLLTFGYNPYVKGLDIALDAVEELNKKETVCNLLVSAQKLTYDYIEKRYGNNLPSYVELLEPVENIVEVYNKADIILSPSRSEGFSFALLEGIYCGLPAVYSDIPGTSWADEMKGVYKFSSENASDMAKSIEKCVADGVIKENIEYNRKIIKEKYSLSVWSDKMLKFINDIIKF